MVSSMHQVIPLFTGNEEQQEVEEYGRPELEKQTSNHLLHSIELVEDSTTEHVTTDTTQQTINVYTSSVPNTTHSEKLTDTSLSKLEVSNNLVDIEVPFRIELETADGDIQTITLPQLGSGNGTTILAEEVSFKSFSQSHTSSDGTITIPSTRIKSNQDTYIIDNEANSNILKPLKSATKHISDESNKEQVLSPAVVLQTSHVENDKYLLQSPSLTSRRKKNKISKNQNEMITINNQSTNGSGILMSALEWLAGITEYINETMQYGCSGKPEPLVFHAPEKYFELLRTRISDSWSSGKLYRQKHQICSPHTSDP